MFVLRIASILASVAALAGASPTGQRPYYAPPGTAPRAQIHPAWPYNGRFQGDNKDASCGDLLPPGSTNAPLTSDCLATLFEWKAGEGLTRSTWDGIELWKIPSREIRQNGTCVLAYFPDSEVGMVSPGLIQSSFLEVLASCPMGNMGEYRSNYAHKRFTDSGTFSCYRAGAEPDGAPPGAPAHVPPKKPTKHGYATMAPVHNKSFTMPPGATPHLPMIGTKSTKATFTTTQLGTTPAAESTTDIGGYNVGGTTPAGVPTTLVAQTTLPTTLHTTETTSVAGAAPTTNVAGAASTTIGTGDYSILVQPPDTKTTIPTDIPPAATPTTIPTPATPKNLPTTLTTDATTPTVVPTPTIVPTPTTVPTPTVVPTPAVDSTTVPGQYSPAVPPGTSTTTLTHATPHPTTAPTKHHKGKPTSVTSGDIAEMSTETTTLTTTHTPKKHKKKPTTTVTDVTTPTDTLTPKVKTTSTTIIIDTTTPAPTTTTAAAPADTTTETPADATTTASPDATTPTPTDQYTPIPTDEPTTRPTEDTVMTVSASTTTKEQAFQLDDKPHGGRV